MFARLPRQLSLKSSQPEKLLNTLLRSALRGCAVLEILMYRAHTLRFLRSGRLRIAFARDGSSTTSKRVFKQSVVG